MFCLFFFSRCIADFSLWKLDWLHLFTCVLFQTINHFNQTVQKSSSDSFPISACWSSEPEESGLLKEPGSVLLHTSCCAVISVSVGLHFSSGVQEASSYSTVYTWRLRPQCHLVRRTWTAVGSIISLWEAMFPLSLPNHFSIAHLCLWPVPVLFHWPCGFSKLFLYFCLRNKDRFSYSDFPSSKHRQPLVCPLCPEVLLLSFYISNLLLFISVSWSDFVIFLGGLLSSHKCI